MIVCQRSHFFCMWCSKDLTCISVVLCKTAAGGSEAPSSSSSAMILPLQLPRITEGASKGIETIDMFTSLFYCSWD